LTQDTGQADPRLDTFPDGAVRMGRINACLVVVQRQEVSMPLDGTTYGFWVVAGGLIILLGISLAAIFRYPSVAEAAGVITAAGTVIGTIVGAFFGVHAGAAAGAKTAAQAETGRQQAEAARQQAETARGRAEAVNDVLMGGIGKVAAAAQPGSDVALAVQQVIDSAGSAHAR
jgi:hypothetical protein